MSNSRRLAAFLVLSLAGAATMPPSEADAGQRLRIRKDRSCNPYEAVSHKELEVLSVVTVKGAVFAPNGSLRLSASIFRTVKTHEATPVVIGGSDTTPITTNATNGSYTVTYDTANLGPSKQFTITFRKNGSSNFVTVGPFSGVAPPTGFAHVINVVVPD